MHESMPELLQAELQRRASALAEVRALLIDGLKVALPPERIELDAPLFGTGLGLDSVDAVELVVALETRFGLRLSEGHTGPAIFRTVQSLVELVLARTAETQPGSTRLLPSMAPGLRAIRTATALHVAAPDDRLHALRIGGAEALEAVSRLVPTRLQLRDAQARQTLLLDADGIPLADALVAADDEDFLLLTSGLGEAELLTHVDGALAGMDARAESLTSSHAVVSLHGPWAWELLAEAISPDVLALPYLSFFRFDDVILLRAGTTGEFGYHALVPAGRLEALLSRVRARATDFDLVEVGIEDVADAAAEAWFYDPRRVDRRVDAVDLGLGWRLDLRRDFIGREALDRAYARPPRRPACWVGDGPLPHAFGRQAPAVISSFRSGTTGRSVRAVLVDADVAVAGLVLGPDLRSVAPPLVDNRSLQVDPRRHSYRTEDEIEWRSLDRVGGS